MGLGQGAMLQAAAHKCGGDRDAAKWPPLRRPAHSQGAGRLRCPQRPVEQSDLL